MLPLPTSSAPAKFRTYGAVCHKESAWTLGPRSCTRMSQGRGMPQVVFGQLGVVRQGDSGKPKLYAYMVGIAKQHGCKVHIVNGTKDHVHTLLAAPTTACLADLMRFVKGSSSRWVHQVFLAKGSFGWQRGFASFGVSRSRLRDVYRYIERQEEHHKKVSFKEGTGCWTAICRRLAAVTRFRACALPPAIPGRSRMSQRSRVDLCGGCRAIGIPTATHFCRPFFPELKRRDFPAVCHN